MKYIKTFESFYEMNINKIQKKLIFIAFDNNSSSNFSETYKVSSVGEAHEFFNIFSNNVPFKSWFYEIEDDEDMETYYDIDDVII